MGVRRTSGLCLCAPGGLRLVPLHLRTLGLHPLRLDLGGRRALGLRDLSLRTLGLFLAHRLALDASPRFRRSLGLLVVADREMGNTIGWCALGFDNRPVGSFAYGTDRGWTGGPRDARDTPSGRGWSFANRSDMGRADIHRRRVEVPLEEARHAVVWSPDASPDREFRQTRGGSGRRGDRDASPGDGAARVYVRPSPGDSTPELRSDPTTTIPSPESRRGRTIGQDGFKSEQDNRRGRARRDDPSPSVNEAGPSTGSDTAQPRPAERGTRAPQAGFRDDPAARGENVRERPTRDPLLDRFFRSITRPNSMDRAPDPPGNNDPSTQRREPSPSRDDSSARERSPRERSRPQESRPPEARRPDENRERSRPSGGERSEPRAAPPPRSTPQGGADDQRGAKRRSPKEG